MLLALLPAALVAALLLPALPAPASAQSEECPFGPWTCPVTLDNVVEVYFHAIDDEYSCQQECQVIDACNYWTMFAEPDVPVDHKKCFLFKECDPREPCENCITGPEFPPIEPCLGGNFTCDTTLQNIVDVYYHDVMDDFSCEYQCSIHSGCFWWSYFRVPDIPIDHHKCFLYKSCDNHEYCPTCVTGPKP